MPRFKLILNPQADRGHTAAITARLKNLVEDQALAAAAQGQAVDLTWVTTEGPKHATELARAALEEGYDIVVAVGGDGTVHEVVNGLMQIEADRRPLLGILPVGSGNDFAYNIGVPSRVEEAAHCLFANAIRIVDAGTITDGNGRTEYWDNTIGIGFSGAVNIAARRLKRLRGFLLYLAAVLQTILFKPPALNARYHYGNGVIHERPVSMVSLCNGPREGGGFPVAPDARMDDGLITYTIMRQQGRLGLLYFLPIVMNARHLQYTDVFEGGNTPYIKIGTDQIMAIHTDGEVFGPWETGIREVEVRVIPSALRVLTCGDGEASG